MYSLLCNSRFQLSQGKIFWREVGEGPNLVFLHGSWHDSSQWLPILDRLSENYHCFAPDLLGFGDSESPDIHHSINLAVDCLAEYLDALKLDEVYLIGDSLGGWVAASFALKYLERVKGLILISPEGVQVPSLKRRRFWSFLLTSQLPLVGWLLRSLYPVAKLFGREKQLKFLLKLRRKMRFSTAASKLLFQSPLGRNPSRVIGGAFALVKSGNFNFAKC